MKPSGVVWLASYPKSGNTWIRILLENLLGAGRGFDLNMLRTGKLSAHRAFIEPYSPVPCTELLPGEEQQYRAIAYRALIAGAKEYLFLKVHDKFSYLEDSQPIFPLGPKALVLYIVRHPYDVTISLSHHLGCTIDEAVYFLNSGLSFGGGRAAFSAQMRQDVGSWSEHVVSWLQSANERLLLIKYEDLHSNPVKAMVGICKRLGIFQSISDIEQAVEKSSFDELRRREAKEGFYERPPSQERFFRSGSVGDGVRTLSGCQILEINRVNSKIMKHLGYEVINECKS